MRGFLLFTFLLTGITTSVSSQDFTGQWKGKFVDKSTPYYTSWGGDTCEYVLDLTEHGKDITGYSYTYFYDRGKRYYTICTVVGFVNPQKNYVEVREVKRTKTNVPVSIQNCFQVHKLTYSKTGNNETLGGSWIPAPKQNGDCGHGITILNRRTLKRDLPAFAKNHSGTISNFTAQRPKSGNNNHHSTATATKPVTKNNNPVIAKQNPKLKEIGKSNPHERTKAIPPLSTYKPVEQEKLITEDRGNNTNLITSAVNGYEKRNSTVLRTLEVSQSEVQISLYDNGEIDGDSISLFYNDRLILAHQRLSDKPITLTIDVDDVNNESNELIMYADNLGTIPPNTALMVVTDGVNRYEVRITSDLQKSGAIRFKLRPKNLLNLKH